MTNHRHIRMIVGALSAILLLPACMAEHEAVEKTVAAATETQPRLATYRCGDGNELTIENSGGAVLVKNNDEVVELPAAPSDQRSRYAQSIYALLLEGPEAMWFAGRKPPMTCRR